MPGNAQTEQFMLGTATVMLGPQEDLYDLTPNLHSIGLVKNFSITAEPTYVELTQGVKNSIVHSTMTGNAVRATMEAFEFTAKNLGYALALEGAETLAPQVGETTVDTATLANATVVPVADASDFSAGDYIMIKANAEDNFIVRKVVSIATDDITVDQPIPVVLGIGTPVMAVNMIAGGSKKDQPYYSAKIAGKLANGSEIVLHLPKLRIVRGFTLAFATDNYGNLPLEFTMYDQVPTDPFFTAFGGPGGAQFQIYAKN